MRDVIEVGRKGNVVVVSAKGWRAVDGDDDNTKTTMRDGRKQRRLTQCADGQ